MLALKCCSVYHNIVQLKSWREVLVAAGPFDNVGPPSDGVGKEERRRLTQCAARPIRGYSHRWREAQVMDRWPMAEIACMTIKKEVILHYKKFAKSLQRGCTVLQDCWPMGQIAHNCDEIM